MKEVGRGMETCLLSVVQKAALKDKLMWIYARPADIMAILLAYVARRLVRKFAYCGMVVV